MLHIMFGLSEDRNESTCFQSSPLSSQSLSSPPSSSRRSNRTIVSAKQKFNTSDEETAAMQPSTIRKNNYDNDGCLHPICEKTKTQEKCTKGNKSQQKYSCNRMFSCCVRRKSKSSKNSSFFTRLNDDNTTNDNNDHVDNENKSRLISESLDTENNDISSAEEATLRLKDCFKNYEERQKYKSIIQDTPLYQIYTEKVARNESKRDARRLLAVVQPGSLQNPSNNLKFDDELFAAIDGDESELNNQYSSKISSKGANSPQPSVHMSNSEQKNPAVHSPDSSSSRTGSRNTDAMKASSYKRSHSNSSGSEKNGSRRSLPKPRRQTHEVRSFVNEVAGTGPNRVQWCAMPQVVSASLAKDLPDYQRKLQEALFEVITSEASYYRTLHILMEKFYKAQCMQPESKSSVITAIQKRHLFSNISEIFFTSETFLRDMELYFLQNPMIPQLCEIIYEHAEFHFENYVKYVQNQMYQLRTLSKLLSSPAFVEAVRSIQQQPSCGFLDLNSFLLLPMQRVTRLRLLLVAILHYAPKNSVTYQGGLVALASLERVS
ncbi:unnamed protein product [Heterobilharzia americana]|nr:unnamed protein product [Heterobilharzia americana]